MTTVMMMPMIMVLLAATADHDDNDAADYDDEACADNHEFGVYVNIVYLCVCTCI